jgi:DNA-binding PadR family transcriptional regulator
MSLKILEALNEHGGVATSTELKNVLGHDSTRLVNYRKDKYLKPAGLIDTRQPEEDDSGGIPTLEWSLTEKGLETLEELDESSEEYRDLGDRVGLLEDQVGGMLETLEEIQEEGIHTGSDTGSDEQVMELIEAVERVESRLDEIESNPIFDEEMQTQLNAIMIFAGISKDTFIEERGGDYLDERWPEKEEEITLF